MTAHQQTKLNELARDYASTKVWDHAGTHSLRVECFDVTTPDLRDATPVAKFLVAPSGFKERIDMVSA